MAIVLPEKFEVGDIVEWTNKMRIPLPNELEKRPIYIVKQIDWRYERLRVYGMGVSWLFFKELTIVKKNCPIVKLLI